MRDSIPQASAPAHFARFLILSYFVALSLGLIRGADLSGLLSPVLNTMDARILTGGIVVSLAALVLFDKGRRAAALLLALMLFSASYLSLLSADTLSGFWRDLALIGALLLTAGVVESRESPRNSDESEPDPLAHVQKIVSTPQMLPDTSPGRNLTRFQEDFDLVRQA